MKSQIRKSVYLYGTERIGISSGGGAHITSAKKQMNYHPRLTQPIQFKKVRHMYSDGPMAFVAMDAQFRTSIECRELGAPFVSSDGYLSVRDFVRESGRCKRYARD
jgi:hypothetical protein